MPRYFFDFVGKRRDVDLVGTELPSAEYAKREGRKLFGAVLLDEMFDAASDSLCLIVMDEGRNILICYEMNVKNKYIPKAA